MDDQALNSLREALKFSPDNLPLKLHLAEMLIKANRLAEAEKEFAELMQLSPAPRYRTGLASVFYHQGEYSKCNVILEEMVAAGQADFEALVLHAKALLKEGALQPATRAYQQALELRPGFRDEELDQQLRVPHPSAPLPPTSDEDEEAEGQAPGRVFMQIPSLGFADVGGMASVKKEIELKIIKPLLHPELYKAYGKKIGGGILLYGPPGCGKTYLAKATAGQVKATFINIRLNDILDMWIGNSEKNLHQVFELARQNTPCVLFIDEIDALGASRSDMKQSAGRHLINQFLQELDGIDSSNEGILVLGATNTPWHLDPAFRRPGRFDRIVFVPPPDEAAREAILHLKLKQKPTEGIDAKSLAKKLEHYSGADLEALVDIAIEAKLEAAFLDGVPKPLTTNDLLAAAKKHRPTTQEWFATAKNFALFANEAGLYDDILTYLKIKK
ncbi:MAG: AAA family ATPase [Bernardetiaceae bacterium]|jgi:SpoVK/Ycf46/Vps4 family AAA+-type ATPase|nr:AAA family ATPase [Bernardetiaceae bacterium]